MRVVFAGTPAFAVPALEAVAAHPGVELAAVYTQPDRPSGRGRVLTPGPVRQAASDMNLPVRQPQSLAPPRVQGELDALESDLMVVVAYGLLLPRAVLDAPKRGCVNVHASLLPRWRGAAPIQRAIEAGDEVTGVTLMRMAPELDSGPILARKSIPIAADDTGGSLHDRLSVLGAALLSQNLDAIFEGGLRETPQDASAVTWAPRLSRRDAALDWRLAAEALERKIRAFNPWPGADAVLGGDTLRILRAGVVQAGAGGRPGEVLSADADGWVVRTGRDALALETVQKPGGRRMAFGDFLNGARIVPGMVFQPAPGADT